MPILPDTSPDSVAEPAAFLTVGEAAKLLRIGRSAAYVGVRRGEIPSVRVGRLIRVPRSGLLAMPNGADVEAGGTGG